MQQYIARRLLLILPTILGVAIFTFVVLRILPGDIAFFMLSAEGGRVTAQQVEAVHRDLGLHKPVHVQFGEWFWDVLRLDFGDSFWTKRPVIEEIRARLPLTLQLAIMATIVAVLLAIPLGTLAALRQDTWIDYLMRVISIAGLAIPSFWMGILLILFLVILFSWSPPMLFVPLWENPVENLKQLVWPALAVGYRYSAVAARMTRSSLLEVLREDYIRTAWAKGLRERAVVLRHALKNALLPVITVIGFEFAFLIGGLVVTETVFNLNGVGRLVVEAILHRDFPLIQALVLLIAVVFTFSNLLVDLLYCFLDPRIRYR